MTIQRIQQAVRNTVRVAAAHRQRLVAALVGALVSVAPAGDSAAREERPMTTESAPAASAFLDVLINGGFERANGHVLSPAGWSVAGRTERVESSAEGGGRWALRLSSTAEEPNPRAAQWLEVVQPVPVAVTVAGLVRIRDVQVVGEGKGGARIRVTFLKEDGEVLRRKTIRTWDGTFGWRPWAGSLRIPRGAARVELALELDEATGQATFDEVEVLWNLPDDYDRENLVVDGGFEYVTPLSSWELDGGAKVAYPGAAGRGAMQADLKRSGRAAASQRLILDDPAIREATVEFTLRLKDVEATERKGGVKVALHFLDAREASVGKPTILGPWTETQKTWVHRAKRVRVPPGTRSANLELMLDGARGVVWFDEVRVTVRVGEHPIARRLETRTDTAGWTAFEPSAAPLTGPFDASVLLDPPAGRHGFLTVEDGRFVFDDGTPARFFGVNIDAAANFPSHEDAERIAQRLAQLGCNLVRLHHLDAPWATPNIFDADALDTLRLSRESLDRLAYFIAQLKARGIYIYLDLLVSREFRSQDGVPAYRQLSRGAKLAAQYSPRLIQLQKAYARDLLTHQNRYTNRRLVDDPALVLVALINESSLAADARRFKRLPGPYRDELDMLWGEYLSRQGADGAAIEAGRYLEVDDPVVEGFYAGLQQRYFDEMSGYLRHLGLRIPIAGSNRSSLSLKTWELATNATLDFIDRHAYWDHPEGGYGDLVRFENRPITEAAQRYQPVAKLSVQRMEGMPFVVSEWNIPWPNEYRAMGPLLMAAYASFQEWDGLIVFSFDGELAPRRIADNFDVSTMPEIFLQLPAAARLFHGREIQPARVRRAYPLEVAYGQIEPSLALLHGVSRVREGAAPPEELALASNPWVSDTGELHWDGREARVLIQSPRVQAVLGRVDDAPLVLGSATVSVSTPFACLSVVSLDARPLEAARHVLLTTVARSENAGTVYSATRTLLRDSGGEPILMEPVVGVASVPLAGRRLSGVFALDARGGRSGRVTTTTSEERVDIPLGAAHAYEILFEETAEEPSRTSEPRRTPGGE